MSDLGRTYTLAEVAEYLMVSNRTVWNYIATGKLKAFKLGNSYRVTKEALEEFQESLTADNKVKKHKVKKP
ncbi:MAG TPA: helix-turn-helix domain-containing protein [Bacilli bacterium]|jgi:excisionase family DNA binding protein|nr:helix-turn-helix domain-containing protein [Bacilli bacterium]